MAIVSAESNRHLPSALEGLSELSLDLRWTASQTASRVWHRLNPEMWERTRSPYLILLNTHRADLEAAVRDEALRTDLRAWLDRRAEYLAAPSWYQQHEAARAFRRVAYFCMEFGLCEGLPIYSGGLGILAGDHLKTASDLGIPLVGIGILYQQGYFRQALTDDGRQREMYPYNDPSGLPVTPAVGPDGRWPRVRIPLPGRTLYLRIWRVKVGRVDLYLLDSNDPMNSPCDRGITANLYPAEPETRLYQEIVLGIGGWLLLEELGIDADVCHINEGHAALAILARARAHAIDRGCSLPDELRATRPGNVFTTHTPVEAAFDRFPRSMMLKALQPYLDEIGLEGEAFLSLGRPAPRERDETFNMACFAVRGCGFVNAVSRLHGGVSRALFAPMFPRRPLSEVPIRAITNGVHIPTWDSAPANRVWREACSGRRWLDDIQQSSGLLADLPDERLWEFRAEARRRLIEYVRRRLVCTRRESGADPQRTEAAADVLDEHALTLGFARRFTEYKRPTLLFFDEERLARILAQADRPVQLLVAGKAHPNDEAGKAAIERVNRFAARAEVCRRVVFVEDYDMGVAEQFAMGVDVWINTPRRPFEACGTSGMKVIANGGLNFSTLDGWWDEAFDPAVGWRIGNGSSPVTDESDADSFYTVLERDVIPEFFDRDERGISARWVARIRRSMMTLTARFGSERMVKEYVEQAYAPAARHQRDRGDVGAAIGQSLASWRARIGEHWDAVQIRDVGITPNGSGARFTVAVRLEGLAPDDIRAEIYADAPPDAMSVTPMRLVRSEPESGIHTFECDVHTDRPPAHFTPRVVPFHPNAILPLEAPEIRWWR